MDRARSADWSDHNGDLANSRYAPFTDITLDNVGKLALEWSFDAPAGNSFSEQTPLVIDGVMYFGSGIEAASRIDADDGNARLVVRPGATDSTRHFSASAGPRTAEGRIYGFGGQFEVFAVDAKTGENWWSRSARAACFPPSSRRLSHFKYPGEVSAANIDPVPAWGIASTVGADTDVLQRHSCFFGIGRTRTVLIIGGLLIAADGKTGAIKWVFNTVPQGPDDDGWELATDTWIGGVRHGGGVWTQPAIDPSST